MPEAIAIRIALLLAVAFLCQWTAWRIKLPAILFLLLAGILAGPVTGFLDPDRLMGDLLFPFISLSVAVILFEGSLTLKWHEIVGVRRVVRNLVSYGMLVTWMTTAGVCRAVLGFSWELCFLFGALMVVTGPTVIVPMLRTVRPNHDVASILRWEGILIDPIGATLAVLTYEFILAGTGAAAWYHALGTFGVLIAAGSLTGGLAGWAFGIALRNHWLPGYLLNLAALALVTGTFTAANHLQEEAGLLAVTVMGAWLANMKNVDVEDILDFKENLSVLLISMLFILLAARMDFEGFRTLGWPALLVLLAIQFLARPLDVMVSAVGSRLTWPERHLLAWIAPRGIVAAAISALFAIRLEAAGFAEAPLLIPLTFLVIVGTVLLQSATAGPIARRLGVAEPDPKGFLVVGANPVARAVASAIEARGFRAMLTDTYWDNVVKARMEGLSVYFGNPVSEHADRHLDLVGIGRLLGLTPHEDQNALAATHYRFEFGPEAVFTLQAAKNGDKSPKMHPSSRRTGRRLFGKDVTYAKLASLLAGGAEIRATKLTESFTLDKFTSLHGGRAICLFAIDPKQRIHVFTVGGAPEPVEGWTLLSLLPADPKGAQGTPDRADRKEGP